MATSPIFCHHCGTQNVRSDRFCFSCGYMLQVSIASTSATSPAWVTNATSSVTITNQSATQILLKQRYCLLRCLGKGGMGAVYLARDIQLGDRLIAVKEMNQSNLSGPELQAAVDNFKREALMLAKLHHPNLPTIYDHFTEAGRWYLVMSFIKGETLETYQSRLPKQRLPLKEVLQIGLALCNVLDYLHSLQPPIIFRDLKPGNIMRGANGQIFLIDFGIARHFKPGQTKDTHFFASVGYAPLEQFGQGQTSERSDIYSLGATLYRLLSGYDLLASPYRLPLLQTLVPTVPDQLARLIMQMLELEEEKRPISIRAVQHKLEGVQQESEGVQQEPQRITVSVQPQPVRKTVSLIGKLLRIVGMLLGSAFALLGLYFALHGTFGPGILGYLGGGSYLSNDNRVSLIWDLSLGEVLFFFGLAIFFIARIKKSALPLSRARTIEAKVGRYSGIIAIILGVIIAIIGVKSVLATGTFDPGLDNNGEVEEGLISLAAGIVIWLATRIWIQKPFFQSQEQEEGPERSLIASSGVRSLSLKSSWSRRFGRIVLDILCCMFLIALLGGIFGFLLSAHTNGSGLSVRSPFHLSDTAGLQFTDIQDAQTLVVLENVQIENGQTSFGLSEVPFGAVFSRSTFCPVVKSLFCLKLQSPPAANFNLTFLGTPHSGEEWVLTVSIDATGASSSSSFYVQF